MAESTGTGDRPLAPDEAFAALGNETRVEILRALADASEPLSFTDLRERVGIRQGGEFNYHLEKLVGHFVRKTADGYGLYRAGERVVEAVLSGAVTDSPVIERTGIDQPCHYCGAPSIEVSYREEQVGVYCPRCRGTYGGAGGPEDAELPAERERLGYLPFPPAGVEGRSPRAVLQAAFTWFVGEMVTAASGVCPRCAAPIEDSVNVCEGHDASGELCDRCGRRYAVTVRSRCENCPYDVSVVFVSRLLAVPDLWSFLVDHGLDRVGPSCERFWRMTARYDEEVLRTDPFAARFTFTVEDDTLAVTVDEDLSVLDVARSGATGSC